MYSQIKMKKERVLRGFPYTLRVENEKRKGISGFGGFSKGGGRDAMFRILIWIKKNNG